MSAHNIKSAMLVLAFISFQNAYSDILPPALQTVADYVAKKNACFVAVAEIPKDGKFNEYHVRAWREQLVCVQDLTTKAGTIDEAKGCAIAWFNSTSNRYLPIQTMDSFGRAGLTIVEGKTCVNGGFEELTKRKLGMYGSSSVMGQLNGVSSEDNLKVIVFSAMPKVKEHINKSIVERIRTQELEDKKQADKNRQDMIAAKQKEAADKVGRTVVDGSWSSACMRNDSTTKEFGGYDQNARLTTRFNKDAFETVTSFWGERDDCGNSPDLIIVVKGTFSVDVKGNSGTISYKPTRIYFEAGDSSFKRYLDASKFLNISNWDSKSIRNFDLYKFEPAREILKSTMSKFTMSMEENRRLIKFSTGIPIAFVADFKERGFGPENLNISFFRER
jgi:hypothetical protein